MTFLRIAAGEQAGSGGAWAANPAGSEWPSSCFHRYVILKLPMNRCRSSELTCSVEFEGLQ
ncbi:MAG TPA: hypothetical protein VF703_13700 [Pyrinomonadaceae bacterium]